jgi:multiple sugar transport system permease protein
MTAVAIPRPAAPRRRSPDRGGRFLLPLLVVMALTSLYPTFYSLYMSFFNWDWGKQFDFVGLANYAELLTSSRFHTALWNTIVFTVGAVCVELAVGLGLALAVNRLGRGAGLVRTLMLVPLMVSGIVVALTWKILLDPTYGPIGLTIREVLGIPAPGFLGDPGMAMASIILVDTWWQTAFVFIVLSAGLQSLPREPLEAAEVDGAGALARLRYVTLPLLRRIILVILLFRTIDCLKVFAIIFGTTGGGPLTLTESVQMTAYRIAFKQSAMSMSMTMMVVFAAIIVVVVFVYRRRGAQAVAEA